MISWLALALYGITLLVLLGLRSLIQYRRTGNSGWRNPAPAADPPQFWSRILMGTGALAYAVAPVLDVTGALSLLPVVDDPAVRVAGLILATVAMPAVAAAQLSMGAAWRIGVDHAERTSLLTTGAFAVVRNPIYSTVTGFAIGMTTAVPNVVAVAGLVLAVAGIQWQVRGVEEPYLERQHGDDFRAYAARVGRFVPGIGRMKPTARV